MYSLEGRPYTAISLDVDSTLIELQINNQCRSALLASGSFPHFQQQLFFDNQKRY